MDIHSRCVYVLVMNLEELASDRWFPTWEAADTERKARGLPFVRIKCLVVAEKYIEDERSTSKQKDEYGLG